MKKIFNDLERASSNLKKHSGYFVGVKSKLSEMTDAYDAILAEKEMTRSGDQFLQSLRNRL